MDQRLDKLYDEVDLLMREGKFEELNLLIKRLIVKDLETDILLGYLTATLPAKSKLPFRQVFVARCCKTIKDRGEFEEGLLKGLA